MVVTHGGVLRLVASRAGVPDAALVPNLGGYRFVVAGGTLANAAIFSGNPSPDSRRWGPTPIAPSAAPEISDGR